MKKLIFTLALAAGLLACNKEELTDLGRPGFAPEPHFSRVRHYLDGRYPQRDTIWTIRIVGDSMRAAYERLDGYIYDQRNEWVERGTLWEKIR